jgi:hypothetical protein
LSTVSGTRLLMTLVGGDEEVAGQATFHRGAGLEVIVLPPRTSAEERMEEARRLGTDWVCHAEPGEFWAPRGAAVRELLDAVPSRFSVIYGVRRRVGSVELRPVVRPSAAGGRARALPSWYPFDVLAAEPTGVVPAPRRALDEEVTLATELAALDEPGPAEARERLEAIETRLARLETSLAGKLRWRLSHRRRRR